MNGDHPQSFGVLLQQLRHAADLTQEELAKRARLNPGTISDLERGVFHAPRTSTLMLLADALQLSPADRLLFTTTARQTRPATPPVRSVISVPSPLTRLIGREAEERAVYHLIEQKQVRLVTLTGTAGIGKTRLALEIASHLMPTFPDGVVFVPLAHVREWRLIPQSIAQVLIIQEDPKQSLWDSITTDLVAKTMLIVLDNLEHLLEGSALVADLLMACPHVVVLVTSRAPLQVRGEQRYPLSPLDCNPTIPDERSAAEDLFIERARAVQPLLPLTPANLTSITAICRQLDGIPLAIELAAMRAAALPPPALLQQLAHRLRVLVNGPRDLPPRQQTMRDAIAWSYDLLAPVEQTVFRHLAVFVGGWTLNAAQAVCEESADDGIIMLSTLVDANLIQHEPQGDAEEPRYAMLEILREYGLEQLTTHGEVEQVQRRHAEYMLTLVRQADAALSGPEQGHWLTRLDAEQGNLRTALHWAQEHDASLGLRVAAAVWRFWYSRRHLREGRSWLEKSLAQTRDMLELQPVQAQACFGASVLAAEIGDYDQAEQLADTSYRIFQATGDIASMCSILNVQGHLATERDRYRQADSYYRQALDLSRTLGDTRRIANILNSLAIIATEQGRYDESHAWLAECLTYYREHGHHLGIAGGLTNLGNLLSKQGQHTQAAVVVAEALHYARQSGNPRVIAAALDLQGEVATGQRDFQQAFVTIEQSQQIFAELDDKPGSASSLLTLGDLAYEQGEWQQAEAYYCAEIEMAQQIGTPLGIAKGLAGWARALQVQGKADPAVQYASKAAAMCADLGITPQARISVQLEETQRATRQAIGETAFQAAWKRGKMLSLDEVLERAEESSTPNS